VSIQMIIEHLRTGDKITYDRIIGINDIETGSGTITKITEASIFVQRTNRRSPDEIKIKDLLSGYAKIYELVIKEDEDMAPEARPVPTDLAEVFQACDCRPYRVAQHFHTGYKTVCNWLFDAGLINENNKPIIQQKVIVTEPKNEEILASVDAGQAIQSMGCIKPELSDKATEVALEDDNGCNYCERCGEPAEEQVEKAWYCPDCYQVLKKQEYLRPAYICPNPIGVEVPNEIDFLDEVEEDEFVPAQLEQTFDRSGLILEVIENTMELAMLRDTPNDITLGLIAALVAVR